MLKAIYISNFKSYDEKTIKFDGNHSIIIGENDCGKTTILEALNVFFNEEKIDKIFVRDTTKPVEIGIYLDNGNFLMKTYKGATYKEDESQRRGEFTLIENIKYIYVDAKLTDPSKIISDLAIAKTLEKITLLEKEVLKEKMNIAVNEIIGRMNTDLIVINNGNVTSFDNEQTLKLEGAFKFTIKSNGIAIEARGLGYQKNLIYCLLANTEFKNVVLGIDEVENSLSINNTSDLIKKLQENFIQTIITTHSKKVIEVKNEAEIIPIFSNNACSVAELLSALDNTDNKLYLLVEGKFDVPWVKKVLSLLGIAENYIVVPSFSESNISTLKRCLEDYGKRCVYLKDGDTYDNFSLGRETIELYTPLEALKNILGIEIDSVPQTKGNFFGSPITNERRNTNSVKSILSDNAKDFLTRDNPLVNEIKSIIESQII